MPPGESAPVRTVADWPHEYHLVNQPGDFTAFLNRLNKQTRFAVDLETTSLDPHEADIVGFAFLLARPV